MTHAARRMGPRLVAGFVAGVVAMTAWIACAIVAEAGPLSWPASGTVSPVQGGLTLPQLEAVPVTATTSAVTVVPAGYAEPAPVLVKKRPQHALTPQVPQPSQAVSTKPFFSFVTVVDPVTPVTVTRPSTPTTHAPVKKKPLPVGVTVSSSPGKGGGGTSTGTTVTTGTTGPVGTGVTLGTGAASVPLPPVDGAGPGSPFPTPTSPPISGVAGPTTGPSPTTAPR